MKQKKYLIIRLSSIGDVLHATTVARNLKKSDPSCHITWMVSRTASELLQDNPDIDEVFIWSREDFEKALHGKKLKAALQTIALLRKFYAAHTFAAVIDIVYFFFGKEHFTFKFFHSMRCFFLRGTGTDCNKTDKGQQQN